MYIYVYIYRRDRFALSQKETLTLMKKVITVADHGPAQQRPNRDEWDKDNDVSSTTSSAAAAAAAAAYDYDFMYFNYV